MADTLGGSGAPGFRFGISGNQGTLADQNESARVARAVERGLPLRNPTQFEIMMLDPNKGFAPPNPFDDLIKHRVFTPTGSGTKVPSPVDLFPQPDLPPIEPSPGGGGAGVPPDLPPTFSPDVSFGPVKLFLGRAARVAGRALRVTEVLSPFMTAYDLVQTYLEPSDYEHFRRRQALPRSTGPKRRPLAGPVDTNPDIGVDVRLDRRRGGPDQPTLDPLNTAFPDPFSLIGSGVLPRVPGKAPTRRVATRRDPLVGTLPSSLTDPMSALLLTNQPKKNPGPKKNPFPLDEANRRVDDTIKRLTSPDSPGGPNSSSPSPGSSPSPTTTREPAPSTQPRCASDDPCMQRAAAKRREQRKKAKECQNPTFIDRKIRTCQPSNQK